MQPPLRISSQEPPIQVSKWLTCPILIDTDEMMSLFHALGPFYIYSTSGITKLGQGEISQTDFLNGYNHYISSLKNGIMPNEIESRLLFSTIFTTSTDTLYAVPIEPDQQLIRTSQPVIQLQPHRVSFSKIDGKFRSMTFGPDTISWGIQFSYPQLMQDMDKKIRQIDSLFPNTELFHSLQKWVRHHTLPTPLVAGEKKTNVPIRLGKNCFIWINQHPQLKELGLKVALKS